jgi:hypothetical protein
MARTLLSLYRLDRDALAALGLELRTLLEADDHAGVAKLLGLGEALAARIAQRRAVDWFLRDDEGEAAPFHASLRRITKKRALERVWTSEHPSLEGRLRAYEPLREAEGAATAIDRALDPSRVPFFLHRKGATTGQLDEPARAHLAGILGSSGSLRDDDLPPELAAFGDALDEEDGTLLVHDGLEA